MPDDDPHNGLPFGLTEGQAWVLGTVFFSILWLYTLLGVPWE